MHEMMDDAESCLEFPANSIFYYWPRGFLLLAPSFILDRGEHTTRRPSIRIMLTRSGTLDIDFVNGSSLKTTAVLMGPDVRRRKMIARDSGFVLLDFAIHTPEYVALEPLVRRESVVNLEGGAIVAAMPGFERAAAGSLSSADVQKLRHHVVELISGVLPVVPERDPRIEAAILMIHEQRLEDISLNVVAQAVYLSADRLRHLFRQQIGCTVSHYARTAAVWKAMALWSEDAQLTNLAHDVGFHDYSHFHHAFREMFGFSPTAYKASADIRFIRCR